MTALVSVIMPAKNAENFIVTSILSILQQSYINLELIIINDLSTDNTVAAIKTFDDKRIKILNGFGTGISDAFNLGLSKASGKYVCRCDADDLFPLERIATQVKWMEENRNYVSICGMYSSIDKAGNHLVQFQRDSISQALDEEFRSAITRTHFGTFMVKADVLKEINGCRSFFVTAEDIDLQLRISEKGSVFFMAENFYNYRIHDHSITHNQSNSKREFYEKIAREYHLTRLNVGSDPLKDGEIPEIPNDFTKPRSSNYQIINHLVSESWYWHKKNNKKKAVITSIKAIKMAPFNLVVWRNLMIICFKI